MLANFLSKSKPINFLIIIGFFLCIFIIGFFSSLYSIGFSFDKLLKSSTHLLLFLGIFFFFNFIISKNKLTFDNSYAFFLYTLFLSFSLTNLLTYKTLILILLNLLFLRKVYSLKSTKDVLKKIFDAGFWLGISFLIEPLSVGFFVLIYGGIFLHQKITIHTLFSPILGFITPLILYFTYCFWFDKTAVFLHLFYIDDVNTFLFFSKTNISWFLGGVLFLTLVSLLLKTPKALSINNSFKKNWLILILNLVITVIFTSVSSEKNGSEIAYLLFPTSIIIANGLEVINNKLIKNLILITLLIGVVIHQFLL
jgi:hypothetical protein